MIKIKVTHKIGDIVEHSFNWDKFKVIWYDFVETRWIRYICIQSEKQERIYLYWLELKPSRTRVLWFTTD